MCGLAGIFSPAGTFRVTPSYLERMRDTMSHRGPDGVGLWISSDQSVGLAHRRLAIIDLSEAASQPMANDDGSVQIVYNGEIYNHRELRRQLQDEKPIAWRTDHSDTEVILRAYERWGIESLARLRGMFAIAIWDGRKRELWLCRDRFGIKPLYWSSHQGRIAFASEIKALLADPEQPRALDEQALAEYLSLMCTPAPRTLFAGISKLAPGCCVKVDSLGRIAEHRWYDLWAHVGPGKAVSGDGVYEQVRSTVEDAVRSHKVSDVALGVFLSGGMDSSTNALLFSKDLEGPVNTFSIGYAGDHDTYQNELVYARQVATLVNANHHERVLTERDFLEFIPRMIHLQDEPIADPVCMPIHYVSQLARQHGVKVCQIGEGADELFYGYPAWKQWLRLQEALPWDGSGALGRGASRVMAIAGARNNRFFDALNRSDGGRPVFWSSALGLTDSQKSAVLGGELGRRVCAHDSWATIAPLWQRFRNSAWEQSSLAWMTFVELSLRLPELLLMRVDKMAMGVSLEARVPFLDHEVVELACSIPQAVRTGGGESKHLLKQAMRGLLPANIIDRPKRGFGVPVREWLAGELGARMHRQLESFCRDTGIFDMQGVRSLLGGRSRVRGWYLYNFALWHRHFIEGVSTERLLEC